MMHSKTAGRAQAWAFRWLGCCLPGKYIVTVHCPGIFTDNFDCVVDDFGNLVRVPS